MGYIKGQDRKEIIQMPDSIEDYVSEENLERVIEAFIEETDLKELGFTKAIPAQLGRPSYSAADLTKLYVYGYMNRVRSSRRLKAEAERNVEVMWLLKKLTPDHRTISTFRKDNAKALKNLFKEFVRICNDLGLYGKELAGIDGSKFSAVNSNDRNFNKEKLSYKINNIDKQIEKYLEGLNEQDEAEDEIEKNEFKGSIKEVIEQLKARKEKYQEYAQKLEESGETQISQTDPESRRMVSQGKSDISYNVQQSVDSKHKLISAFDVTNSANDKKQLKNMVEATEQALGTKATAMLLDKGYDNASEIAACLMAGYEVHVMGTDFDICLPQFEEEESSPSEITEHKDGRSVYLPELNLALCPMGKILYPSSYKKSKGVAIFRNGKSCTLCRCKCTKSPYKNFEIKMPKHKFTKVYNSQNFSIRQVRIKADKELCKHRKSLAEHPFGTIKRNMDAEYFLTKGLIKVSGELSLTYLAYNLKRAISVLGVKTLIHALKNRNNPNYPNGALAIAA